MFARDALRWQDGVWLGRDSTHDCDIAVGGDAHAADPALIDAAKRRWADGGFDPVIGDEAAGAVDPMGA